MVRRETCPTPYCNSCKVHSCSCFATQLRASTDISASQATQVGLFLGTWTHHTCAHSCWPVADNTRVQLQLLDARQSVLDKVRQRPELLEQSFLLGHTSTPKALILTQQGDVLVSLDNGGALLVWDMQAHRTCTSVPPASPDDRLHTIVAHPDGRHVLVGGTRPAATCQQNPRLSGASCVCWMPRRNAGWPSCAATC